MKYKMREDGTVGVPSSLACFDTYRMRALWKIAAVYGIL